MYLYLNIKLILAYQCLTIYVYVNGIELAPKIKSTDDCVIPVPGKNDLTTPMPSTLASKFNAAFPDDITVMHIRAHSFFKMTCAEGRKMSVCKKNTREIIVKCVTNSSIEYKGFPYDLAELQCVNLKAKFTNEPAAKILDIQAKSPVDQPVGCAFKMPREDYKMPILFTYRTPRIIYPDKDGIIRIRNNILFKMSCAGTSFMTPLSSGITEATVKCVNGSLVEFRSRYHQINTFSCKNVPIPLLVLTNRTCNEKYSVLRVGFQTKKKFLNSYKICFDMERKNTLYTWNFVQGPLYEKRQLPIVKPEYYRTKLFSGINVPYAYLNQSVRLKDILQSQTQAEWYVQTEKRRYLEKGQVLSKLGFVYAYEQAATYFFENTTPMWYLFYKGVWEAIDELIRHRLAKSKNRHLIVSGTYKTCLVPNASKIEHPIYLTCPNKIRVPLFVWKMDYNIDRRTGVVFIGMNNPYKKFNKDLYFCEVIPCPGDLKRPFDHSLLVFCCYRDSFEKAIGKLDERVFRGHD